MGLIVIAVFRDWKDGHHPICADSWSNATTPGADDHSHAENVLDYYNDTDGGYQYS